MLDGQFIFKSLGGNDHDIESNACSPKNIVVGISLDGIYSLWNKQNYSTSINCNLLKTFEPRMSFCNSLKKNEMLRNQFVIKNKFIFHFFLEVSFHPTANGCLKTAREKYIYSVRIWAGKPNQT